MGQVVDHSSKRKESCDIVNAIAFRQSKNSKVVSKFPGDLSCPSDGQVDSDTRMSRYPRARGKVNLYHLTILTLVG
jgi:hypothetical protein